MKKEDGGKKRFKARLVVKEFAQKKGIDFDEMFSVVVKMTSIHIVLSYVPPSFRYGDGGGRRDGFPRRQIFLAILGTGGTAIYIGKF